MKSSALFCLVFGACVASGPRSSLVKNNIDDDALTELASAALSAQLEANGVEVALFNFDVRLDPLEAGGLQIQAICSTRADHLLKGQVLVKGHGVRGKKMIRSMVSQAAQDLAAACR